MRKPNETFTEMRNRLMACHGWDREVATVAARYYDGLETSQDVREMIPEHAQQVIDARQP